MLSLIMRLWTVAILTWTFLYPQSAQAQNFAQDYVGEWSVEGGPFGACKITLTGQPISGALKATTFTCTGPMAFAWTWAPSGNGIVINGTGNARIATLSRSRGALVGQANDGSLVTLRPLSGQRLARGGETGRPGSSFPTPLDGPLPGGSRNECYLRADTGRCAEPRDIGPPTGQAFVRATYDLNVRSAVDMSSPVIAQLRQGQCFTVNWCRDTRWGIRCEVQMDRAGRVGYTIKHYERDGHDYIAFTNACR